MMMCYKCHHQHRLFTQHITAEVVQSSDSMTKSWQWLMGRRSDMGHGLLVRRVNKSQWVKRPVSAWPDAAAAGKESKNSQQNKTWLAATTMALLQGLKWGKKVPVVQYAPFPSLSPTFLPFPSSFPTPPFCFLCVLLPIRSRPLKSS